MWSSTSSTSHNFSIPKPCVTFSEKYDSIQEKLEAISGVDELLSGKYCSKVLTTYSSICMSTLRQLPIREREMGFQSLARQLTNTVKPPHKQALHVRQVMARDY